MFLFDVAKDWVILAPLGIPPARKAGEELAHYLSALRRQGGLVQKTPLEDTEGPAPADTVPVIILKAGTGEGDNGFSWRVNYERVEIYGGSGRGLCNGVFDFLNALGIFWPHPSRERLPAVDRSHPYGYDLKITRANVPASNNKIRRRRILLSRDTMKNGETWLVWAARNKIDGAVFPLEGERSFLTGNREQRRREALFDLAGRYGLLVEIGGWDLSFLVPRRLYPVKRELFRMDAGKWLKDHHFCATNPETIGVLKKEAAQIFQAHPKTDVFHLWPDRGCEKIWCSCPSCRAFSPEEQKRIAVNAAADALAELRPGAFISCLEEGDEEGDIVMRPNTFTLDGLPGEPGIEREGWFTAGK